MTTENEKAIVLHTMKRICKHLEDIKGILDQMFDELSRVSDDEDG